MSERMMNERMRSTIVISDTHLGSVYSNHLPFSEFIRWLNGLGKKGNSFEITAGGRKISIYPPERLILLGDFLELWDPINDDFSFTARHLFESLKDIMDFNCEIVFVTGNHDESLENYAGELAAAGPKITIFKRHYPVDPGNPLRIGSKRFFFLHGHQFDKIFRFTGPLAYTPSFMAGMNSITTRFFPMKGWSSLILFTASLAGYLSQAGFKSVLLTAAVATGIFSASKVFTYLQSIAGSKARTWFVNRPKYKDINEIIEEGYYDRKKDTIVSDFVVFGHTHLPEICGDDVVKEFGKVFVNSGSWVNEEKAGIEKNTWVYIDDEEVLLLGWDAKEKRPVFLDSYPHMRNTMECGLH